MIGGATDVEYLATAGAKLEVSGNASAADLSCAASFARDVLGDAPAVITIGGGPLALALADAAHRAGRLSFGVDAGERLGDERDRHRRLADHAVDRCFVRSDLERTQLLAEGRDAADVDVVGSLTAQAISALPSAVATERPHAFVALDHTISADILKQVTDVCARQGLQFELSTAAPNAREAMERARTAAVIITDQGRYQELAAAAAVPSVVIAPAGARWDLVTSGVVSVAEDLDELPAALDVARGAAPRPPQPQGDEPADLIAAAVTRRLDESPTGCEHEQSLPTEANASGRTFDASELNAVRQVLQAGTLNSTRGTFVSRFEREFADWLGVKHAIACASGSAAVHCALAALKLQAGDEVITTPITDMGALTPIWYEGAVPVFADVDPRTLNVTAETIAAQLTERTRAVIVTHLFGRPCDMEPILRLAKERALPIIEDAAQAFGATCGGSLAGTFGKLSAFSLQQGKHITTGEGGVVCTDDDDAARQVFLYVNKAYGYGDERPDHYFPALNYRMTELQGAVACGQLPKLDEVIARRRMAAKALHSRLSELPGITCPDDPADGLHSYWKWSFLVDERVVRGGAVKLGALMRAEGIACAPRYVQKPAFECQVFTQWRQHPVSSLPLQHNPRGEADGPLFHREDYPGAVRGLEQVVVLPINERYRPRHVAKVADAIHAAYERLSHG